ncbi:MAG: hypothetical protein EOO06_11955 [Chitinophagaceae bacterium]|nr:MAG: hypothetical protein EOO06_11955 [Chitinophagaceae bacterium]
MKKILTILLISLYALPAFTVAMQTGFAVGSDNAPYGAIQQAEPTGKPLDQHAPQSHRNLPVKVKSLSHGLMAAFCISVTESDSNDSQQLTVKNLSSHPTWVATLFAGNIWHPPRTS